MEYQNYKKGGGLKAKSLFGEIFSLENLRVAFKNFEYGKTKKPDVIDFSKNCQKELYRLYDQLRRKTYRHGMDRMKLFMFRIQNCEKSIKRRYETGYCIMQYSGSYMLFLTEFLFLTHIRAELAKARIGA